MGLIDTVYVSDDVGAGFELRCALAALLVKRRGDGHFLPEAFLPRNRRQRFMGELPHQWVEIYASCACGSSIERWIKFCDGIAVECQAVQPRPEPGVIDDASDFGLPS